MTDPRIDALRNAVAEPTASYGPVKIDRIKLSNYKFFYGDFELKFDGKNVLIYGENGSGKSSVYRAMELLAKTNFTNIAKDRNIFAEGAEPVIEFGFSNGKELVIDADLTEIPGNLGFLRGLSVFVPLLDYKKLLKVHYSPLANGESINV